MSDSKFVVFSLQNERYAFPIESVERILAEVPITPVPRSPKLILGVFDLRGETLPAMDLRRRFEFPENRNVGNLIVVDTGFGKLAVRVDQVDGIVPVDQSEIEPTPKGLQAEGDPVLSGILNVNGELTVILQPQGLVPDTVKRKVSKMGANAA